MNKTKVAFFVFVLVSVLDIVGVIFKIAVLIQIFKPLILLSLLVLYVISVSKINKTYILALIFSFFGDVFLMFSEDVYFKVGLVSFLIAHLFFIKIVLKSIQKATVSTIIISSIPYFTSFLILILFLKNSLNELLIPVIIYGLTISIFGTVSLISYLNQKSKKSLLMLVGATVFIVSDTVLAINKFYAPSHVFSVLTMFSYIIAQYFIYRSMIFKVKHN
jgi:uncharacterized membrane protein YhhN